MKAQARASKTATPKPTADYVRSRLLEMKGRVMEEPRGRRELCRLLVERARTVESLGQRTCRGIRQKRRGNKHQHTRSGSGRRSRSEVDGQADESHVRRTAVRREVRTLAKSLNLIIAGRIVAAADLLIQKFRPVGMAALEDGRVVKRAALGSDPYRGFGGAGAAENPREVGRDFDKWRLDHLNGRTCPIRRARGSRTAANRM